MGLYRQSVGVFPANKCFEPADDHTYKQRNRHESSMFEEGRKREVKGGKMVLIITYLGLLKKKGCIFKQHAYESSERSVLY